jgi:hypothetical protein
VADGAAILVESPGPQTTSFTGVEGVDCRRLCVAGDVEATIATSAKRRISTSRYRDGAGDRRTSSMNFSSPAKFHLRERTRRS